MQAPDLVQARAMLLVIIFACAATQEMGEDLNLWGSSSSLGLLSLLDNDGTQLRDLLVSAAAQVSFLQTCMDPYFFTAKIYPLRMLLIFYACM